MSMTVKAVLMKPGDVKSEIRRFAIPADVSSSYDYLQKKVADIFPNLSRGNFSLFWKDPDGDMISFSSGEELMEALGFVEDGIFRIFIKENQRTETAPEGDNKGEVHPGVVCDGCDGPIHGIRYKCMVCPDYDLCSGCEASGLHSQHNMMKITSPHPRGFEGFGGFFRGPPPPFCGVPPPPPPPPSYCGGPAGPNAGPYGFMMPPHMRKWIERYMRRCHNRNPQSGGCGTDSSQGQGSEEQHPKEEKMEGAPDEEYLRTVGESVAAMLDPFGIDVEVDVEHRGRRQACGRKGGHCSRGRQGKGGSCHGPCGNKWKQNASKDEMTEAEKPGQEKPTASQAHEKETVPEAMETTSVDPQPSKTQFNGSKGKDAEDWTVLDTDGPVNGATSAAMPSPQNLPQPVLTPLIYPPSDPKIIEALQQMQAMGFHNEGGWLQKLLQEKDGDISKVLDSIQPRTNRAPDGGYMA